jgi:Xaa-Pro aminopeptidase
MRREKLDAFLVWDRANTRYLTGFQGSASLICLTADHGFFLTDSRYTTVARASVSNLRVVESAPSETDHLIGILKRHRVRRVGFEESVPYRIFRQWCDKLGQVELIEATACIARLRECKTGDEVRRIVEAQRIAEKVLDHVLAQCRPGVTERHLAILARRAIEDEGGDGAAFDPIIASGPNSALPHHQPANRLLKKGDFVILDLGVVRDGYCSDMTRTVVLGRATDRQRAVYASVLEAQRRAISRIRPGVAVKTVDHAARGWIKAKRLGSPYRHSTGHGVGLEIHESPALKPGSDEKLRAGMVVTVEPGIYTPGWGGVRIEDMVLVKRDGREVLGRYPRNLIELTFDIQT